MSEERPSYEPKEDKTIGVESPEIVRLTRPTCEVCAECDARPAYFSVRFYVPIPDSGLAKGMRVRCCVEHAKALSAWLGGGSFEELPAAAKDTLALRAAQDIQRAHDEAIEGDSESIAYLMGPILAALDDYGDRREPLLSDESGAGLIAAERVRQEREEGFSAERDDAYRDRELVQAATAYAVFVAEGNEYRDSHDPDLWPSTWDIGWWRPGPDPIRNLVKAGALLAAEIDRLIRAKAKEG